MIEDDVRWKTVVCGRCGRVYQCTPMDDYMTPADWIGWRGEPVCERCLQILAKEAGAQS